MWSHDEASFPSRMLYNREAACSGMVSRGCGVRMPIRLVDREGVGFRTIEVVGDVADADVHEALAGIWQSPEYDVTLDNLYDLRGLGEIRVTRDGIRELSRIRARVLPQAREIRVAVVAPQDVTYGLSRVYLGLGADTPSHIQLFREIEDAVRWLLEPRD